MSKIRTMTDGRKIFKCPGCEGGYHALNVGSGRPAWSYNGDADSPTFMPSILSTCDWSEGGKREIQVCHSFVSEGRIQFLSDCTHALAGQTVEIPEWPHEPGTFGGIEESVSN